jgi:ABC-2 type transport system ATP-binding protein
MLTVENLTFSYHRKKAPIFRDFSLSLPQRGVYGLLGENGAGKTTLIYMMMGLLTPQGGQVMLDGVNVRRRLPETMNIPNVSKTFLKQITRRHYHERYII